MRFVVASSHDAADVLRQSRATLSIRPDQHNLVLSLLWARAASDEAGRYWIVRDRASEVVVGVVFQSPLTFSALVTTMPRAAAVAAADAIVDSGVALPGIQGEVPTSSAFADRWAQRCGTRARALQGTRLYRLGAGELTAEGTGPGRTRLATANDLDLVIEWMDAFADELAQQRLMPRTIEQRVEAREVSVYEVAGRTVCLVAQTPVVEATVRIAPVYTPPSERRHGFARSCVGDVSRTIIEAGHTCVLFADAANATSNHLYRSLGYRVIGEVMRYEFDTKASPSRSTAAQ